MDETNMVEEEEENKRHVDAKYTVYQKTSSEAD